MRFIFALILTTSLFTTASFCAFSAASFCKCTCKGNSTIIPLSPETSSSTSPNLLLREPLLKIGGKILEGREGETHNTHRANTCNDCNRKFCLDYKLPACKGVSEEEVFTTCFQRDSLKDEAVVFIFMFATAGLLLWALVQPFVQKYVSVARERRSYVPLSSQEGARGESR